MSIWSRAADYIAGRIAAKLLEGTGQEVAEAREYRLGLQPEQLKYKLGAFNDNISLNFTGLIANRIVSQVIGGGFELDFDGGKQNEGEQAKWVKACLDANEQEVFFHRCSLAATEAGTGFVYLMPGGAFGDDETEYPRLQMVDPAFIGPAGIETAAEDFEVVTRYIIRYKYVDPVTEKETGRKRVIEQDGETWYTKDFKTNDLTGGRWEPMGSPIPFVDAAGNAYPFPPMLHWQNMPSVDSVYGEPDITPPMRALQDRVNFTSSNISKIIRFYAHPFRIGKGVTEKDMKLYDSGPDKMLLIPATGDVQQLPALGDLAASMEYWRILRQAMFDTARVVDIDSMQDKLGSLTNFGLRVLYQDNLAMVKTKRELFGNMIEELVRRLQIMGGYEPVKVKVIWPDFLPQNEAELVQAYTFDLTNELASRQTISVKRGYEWEKELERMDDERQAEMVDIQEEYDARAETQTPPGAGPTAEANGRAARDDEPGNAG